MLKKIALPVYVRWIFSSGILALMFIVTTPGLSPAQQLPPGVTMEQWNRLSAAQQQEVLRRLQQSGATQATIQAEEMQLPPVV